jgi:hypothetical protein
LNQRDVYAYTRLKKIDAHGMLETLEFCVPFGVNKSTKAIVSKET